MNLNYSIVLRTLGYGGEKYQALLDSIKAQTVAPAEFIVMIPHGYELPAQQLGIETFIRGEKGMVRQRVDGINAAKSDYLLLIDDDISFPADFVENLLKVATSSQADMMMPAMDDVLVTSQHHRWLPKLIALLSSGAREVNDGSDFALRISALAGTIRLKKLDVERPFYRTQTGAGACIFGKRTSIQSVKLQEELWLEKDCRYVYPEDQVFFYKAYLMGLNTIYAHRFTFKHLDSSASMRHAHNQLERHVTIKHDASRNLLIFWHRFQYSPWRGRPMKRVLSLLAVMWKIGVNLLLHVVFYAWKPAEWVYIQATWRGYRDGMAYLRSTDYRGLPEVMQMDKTRF